MVSTTDAVVDLRTSLPELGAADVERYHTALSNWGRWGADDQLGALNLITDRHRAAAAATVRSGRRVGCALPLPTAPAPENPRPVNHTMLASGADGHGWAGDAFEVASHGFATSHIDALCHVFHNDRIYNGHSSATVAATGAEQMSIHHLQQGVVGRGVLLDIPTVLGHEALEPGQAISVADLETAERRCGVTVGEGDIVFVRTGRWTYRATHGAWDASQVLSGLHASCLPWLSDRGVAALGSDGVSDVIPSGIPGSHLPIHSVGIVAMGLHLLDNLALDELAYVCQQEDRWDYFLTIAPLALEGGTGCPVNPIAVF